MISFFTLAQKKKKKRWKKKEKKKKAAEQPCPRWGSEKEWTVPLPVSVSRWERQRDTLLCYLPSGDIWISLINEAPGHFIELTQILCKYIWTSFDTFTTVTFALSLVFLHIHSFLIQQCVYVCVCVCVRRGICGQRAGICSRLGQTGFSPTAAKLQLPALRWKQPPLPHPNTTNNC